MGRCSNGSGLRSQFVAPRQASGTESSPKRKNQAIPASKRSKQEVVPVLRQGRSAGGIESLTNNDGATCSQGLLIDGCVPVDFEDNPEKPGAAITKLDKQEYEKDMSEIDDGKKEQLPPQGGNEVAVKEEVDASELLWTASLQCTNSVHAFCNYLRTWWGADSGELRVEGLKPLRGFGTYGEVQGEHSAVLQAHNTLSCPPARVTNVIKKLPGLQEIVKEGTALAQLDADNRYKVVALRNFHVLRQAHSLDAGTTFGFHTGSSTSSLSHLTQAHAPPPPPDHHQFSDRRDDTLGPLETTVCIKLTQDPPDAPGSWMQMTIESGCNTLRYRSWECHLLPQLCFAQIP